MTGDDGAFHLDEVDDMRQYALSRGVASSSILIDPHGYRTYDSCYRASKVYGYSRVIAVSQAFHLPRIIFLCKKFGVDVIGVPSAFHIPWIGQTRVNLREIGARTKAIVDIWFWPPRLRYMD